MKISIKIKEIEFEISENSDNSIRYTLPEIKDLITHIISEHNKINPK
jgi:hypothetical protein